MQQRYHDPELGRFLSVDLVTAYSNPIGFFNRYKYANNNPYRFTDPDGRAFTPETIWDAANVGIGVSSAYSNFSEGNIGAGVVDSIGVVVDAAATAIPLVPGGAGAAIKATRSAGEVLQANKAAGKAGEAATRAKLGDNVAGEQVTFKANDGTRARTDFVTKDGGVVETKTGNAKLSTGQTKLKADIDAGRPVTPVGQNATNAGLKSGEATTMKSCTVDQC